MADYLKDILKNQLVELFADMLRLNTITNTQRCVLELGKELAERTDAQLIMFHLSDELMLADIEQLNKNSDELFNFIFSCLTKKKIENEFIKESFKDLYKQLTTKERETVSDYAREMKKICEKYRDDKKCQLSS